MKKSKGYTLIELILVILLLGALSFGVAAYLFELGQSWIFVRSREKEISSARVAINRMVREIRMVNTPSQIDNGFSATYFSFKDTSGTTIVFQQTGTDLMRDSDILASDLAGSGGLNFTYLNSSGNVTSTKLEIRVVKIILHFTLSNQDFYLQSAARIRNL